MKHLLLYDKLVFERKEGLVDLFVCRIDLLDVSSK